MGDVSNALLTCLIWSGIFFWAIWHLFQKNRSKNGKLQVKNLIFPNFSQVGRWYCQCREAFLVHVIPSIISICAKNCTNCTNQTFLDLLQNNVDIIFGKMEKSVLSSKVQCCTDLNVVDYDLYSDYDTLGRYSLLKNNMEISWHIYSQTIFLE